MVIKTVWHWKIRQIDQWNRIECPEIDPYESKIQFVDLIEAKRQFKGERIIMSTNNARTTDHPCGEKKNLDTDFTPFTKIYSKCTVYLNVK